MHHTYMQARDCLSMLMFPPDVTSTPVAVDNNASVLAGFSDNVGDMLWNKVDTRIVEYKNFFLLLNV